MRLSRVLSASLFLAMVVGTTSCGKYSDRPKGVTSTSGVTKLACDASFRNIMEQEIQVFEYIYPDADILPYYEDEKACFDSLMNLSVPSIVVTRELNEQEVKYLNSHKKKPKTSRIAVDAIALIVNKQNDVGVLSTDEIAEILEGKVTDWNEISPSKMGKIEVVFDHEGSSTVKYMRDSLTHGEKFGDNVFAQGSNEAVFEAVKNRKGAIGVIGVSWLSANLDGKEATTAEELAKASEESDTVALSFNPEVNVLKVRRSNSIESYKPYQQYIYEGKYPLYRSIYMITTGVGGTTSNGFYSFVTSVRGQKLILMTGILPGTVYPRMVNLE